MSLSEKLRIGGILQWKVLATFIEGPFTGAEIMRRLRLSSPGTIYPILKTLREKRLIEYAPDQSPGKKVYILSQEGVKEITKIMHTISNRFLIRYVGSYSSSLLDILRPIIDVTQYSKILSTLHYPPIRYWLENADVTYLNLFETPQMTYDLILSSLVCTFKIYGWKEADFNDYTSSIVKSLQPGGTLIMVELERSDNIFVQTFFTSILGFNVVPGISETYLTDCLKKHNLTAKSLFHKAGMLVSISTKPP